MDSLQELRQEFHAILESEESADPPLTPLQLKLKAERQSKENEKYKKQLLDGKKFLKELEEWKEERRELEQKRRERESFMNSFPSRGAYWLHCTMEEHKRTIAEFERTLSPEDTAELNRARNERRTVRAHIKKTVNKLRAACASEDKFTVKRLVTEMSKIQDKLTEKDEAVWALLPDDTVVADQAIGEEWPDLAIDALSQADQFLDGTDPSTAPSPFSSSSDTSTRARLPKTDLPKFSGTSASEYQGWWNAFESLIDGRSDLSKVDKLIYLKSCCIEGASGLAKGYSLTEDNYDHFKLALKDMYGHPR